VADVSIEEVHTTMEIVDGAGQAPPDMVKLLDLLRQQLRQEEGQAEMRDEDSRIRSRAWQSDIGQG
jgi:hypothetical protein